MSDTLSHMDKDNKRLSESNEIKKQGKQIIDGGLIKFLYPLYSTLNPGFMCYLKGLKVTLKSQSKN